MSYSNPKPATYSATNSSVATTELKLYQAFIFSVPIFFTFVLLFLFYLFYLRRRRADWSSLRMRATLQNLNGNDLSRAELGLKKELREMLPIIIYKESFSIKDNQCSVCLGDYQAEDKLQQIPACGHTFHMECIDHWLSSHTTCPLCRLSLLAKAPSSSPDNQRTANQEFPVTENGNQALAQSASQVCEESQAVQLSESWNGDAGTIQNGTHEEQRHDNQVRDCLSLRAKAPSSSPDNQRTANQEFPVAENGNQALAQSASQVCEETQAAQLSESWNGDAGTIQNGTHEEQRHDNQMREVRDSRNQTEAHEHGRGNSA
ncbi:LOW QUALITY PROTEIN: RING-H2 finger protein ATL7-like [Carica papaya]|uniref:LOW QUALITY PROTEIN: RING-H2 finger protein ATL7-like n=1 Tax=Carica papaya TaxID=3649 RepID=UPI000B8C9110|nr:LOW QUALITY PROTEIN: RING-H2 finger protein ATL7-like [Carica papaya]